MHAATAEEGFDLFSRAIVAGDADAWSVIHARYGQLLCSWARRSTLFDVAQESSEDIASEALARAWLALTPERFLDFTDMRALMAYLRACVTSTVIDSARRQRANHRECHDLTGLASDCDHERVLVQLSQIELYEYVCRLLKSDEERLVVYERFVLDLPPRQIQERHPDRFPEVGLIYTTQRNLCDRLRRNETLRELALE